MWHSEHYLDADSLSAQTTRHSEHYLDADSLSALTTWHTEHYLDADSLSALTTWHGQHYLDPDGSTVQSENRGKVHKASLEVMGNTKGPLQLLLRQYQFY